LVAGAGRTSRLEEANRNLVVPGKVFHLAFRNKRCAGRLRAIGTCDSSKLNLRLDREAISIIAQTRRARFSTALNIETSSISRHTSTHVHDNLRRVFIKLFGTFYKNVQQQEDCRRNSGAVAIERLELNHWHLCGPDGDYQLSPAIFYGLLRPLPLALS